MSNLKSGNLVTFQVEILGFKGGKPKDEKGVIKEIIGDMCHIQSGDKSYIRHVSAVTSLEGH